MANDTPLGTDTPLTVQATGTLGGSIASGSIIGGEGTGNVVFESNGVIGTSKPAYRVQSGAFLYSSACSAASGDDSCTEIVVNVDYIADLPSLAVANATVSTNEDQSVALGTITAAITDPDGAETLSLNIDNLPAGASLSDGVNISGTASTVITTWNLANITLTPPLHRDTDFSLSVVATATTPNGDSKSTSASILVQIFPVNDPPAVVGAGIADQANSDGQPFINLALSSSFSDAIDSGGNISTYVLTSGTLPAGLSLAADTGLITGTIDNSASQGAAGIYTLTISAVDSGGLTVTDSFTWTITNVAPVATDNTAAINEDGTTREVPVAIAFAQGLDANGGAIYGALSSSVSITNTIFRNNRCHAPRTASP